MKTKEINPSDYKQYIIIGTEYISNKRFRIIHSNPSIAFGINLWNGRVWGVRHNGKRELLKRIVN